jgi:DNA helicase-2/ATP-dependent DNA helicase PcrA
VDEFQDTNAIQYAWLRLLAGDTGLIACVGDDDQSIYGWRGAKIENIHKFAKEFPGVRTFRLEQNYRSSGNILAAANAVIANNQGRLGKKLWTNDGKGEPLHLYTAFNDLDEARFMVGRVEQWIEQGGQRTEVAILYRVSAQSRVFEEALLSAGIMYRLHGGLRFYERAEIKDALAFLRLLINRDNDAAFERIVNRPPRGIGTRTLEILRAAARDQERSLWATAQGLLAAGELSARAAGAVRAFMQLVDHMAETSDGMLLPERVEAVTTGSGLIDYYRKEKSERAESRLENLQELVTAARQFEYEATDDSDAITEFLAHAALESGEEQGLEFEDCVHLMTLHSAKGLEFPVVFLCGLEEGLFPHQRSSEDPAKLEEERRLCYVGMTRAKQVLYLTHAESRRLHGSDYFPTPSRFLREVPSELMEEIRMRGKVSRPVFSPGPRAADGYGRQAPGAAWSDGENAGFRLGQRVAHAKFGEGVVLKFEGQGNHARVQVNFKAAGSKWLVVAYAKLQAV